MIVLPVLTPHPHKHNDCSPTFASRFLDKLRTSNAIIGELFTFVNKNCPSWTAGDPDTNVICEAMARNTSTYQVGHATV